MESFSAKWTIIWVFFWKMCDTTNRGLFCVRHDSQDLSDFVAKDLICSPTRFILHGNAEIILDDECCDLTVRLAANDIKQDEQFTP